VTWKEAKKEGRKEERKKGKKSMTCPKFKQDLIQTQIQNVTLTIMNRDDDEHNDDNMVLLMVRGFTANTLI
jgi:hypothetical protein